MSKGPASSSTPYPDDGSRAAPEPTAQKSLGREQRRRTPGCRGNVRIAGPPQPLHALLGVSRGRWRLFAECICASVHRHHALVHQLVQLRLGG